MINNLASFHLWAPKNCKIPLKSPSKSKIIHKKCLIHNLTTPKTRLIYIDKLFFWKFHESPTFTLLRFAMPWRCAAFVWRCAVRSASTTPRRGAWSRLCEESRSGTVRSASSRPQGRWCCWVVATQIFFLFNPDPWGKMNPIWRAYFSDGLKLNHQPGWFWENFPGSWFWRYIIIVSFQKMLGDVIYYNMF